ncbi:MAG: acyltransferase [Sphingobacteriales bacterium]|nr:acyltransferase [Sphingobacteriales bacterium]
MFNWRNHLSRTTSSGRFIPEIDGLRFVAVLTVVLFHLVNHLNFKQLHPLGTDTFEENIVLNWVAGGFNKGVELFFAISGFVLALPFIQQFRQQGTPVILKDYYIRRLTRLEPPYILSLLLFFALNIITGHDSFGALLPHFFASLFYVSNFIYPEHLPLINGVTWSLEVEIQFYLLAPFLCNVFMISDFRKRMGILISAILFFSGFNYVVTMPFFSLIGYIQFFAVGLLMADLYSTQSVQRRSAWIEVAAAAAAAFVFFTLGNTPAEKAFFPILIIPIFYYTLFNIHLRTFLSRTWLTVIGGMCYSIYLLHLYIIIITTKFTALAIPVSWAAYVLLQSIMVLPIILVVGALYFIVIEKPCMNKNWVHLLKQRIAKSLQRFFAWA